MPREGRDLPVPLEKFESDEGVVVEEHDGQGPNYYSVYHRKSDDNRPYITADRAEIEDNAAIIYGKLVLFGPVRVEKYPYKGQTRARITPLEEPDTDG